MKNYKVVMIIIILIISFSFSKEIIFLNPGVKIGWEFGKEQSGLILGLELSSGYFVDEQETSYQIMAGVLGYQVNLFKGIKRVYLEGEIGSLFYGVALGGQYSYSDSISVIDWRGRLFGGMLGYASFKFPGPYEISAIAKLPIPLNAGDYRF